MDLTIGPNQFFWPAETVRGFYRQMAASPAARVVLGELVCSKRLPFWEGEIPGAIEALHAAGKEVALTTLALVTLKRERRLTADLTDLGLPVDVNDLTALRHLPVGRPFWVGPLVNVYNEGTLRWLAKRGAVRVCLPPELPLASVATLARAGADLGVAVEVWGHGRLPLALSGRCYHARLHDRAKDSCQFVCEKDPDGRDVETLDGQPFLAVNGIQTLSQSTATAAQLDAKADKSALTDEANARLNATRVAGVILLANVAGTGDAITATVAAALPGVTISVQSTVELIPAADNTASKVTLNVDGLGDWRVRRRDGSDLQPGDIRTNRGVWLRRRGTEWWMVNAADSETAERVRQAQRRVASRDVTLSATEITVKLPPGLNPSITESTLIDILWPDAPWPVPSNTNIALRVTDSAGTVLRSGIARLDRGAAPGPKPGAWWTITAKIGSANDEWQHISRQPTQADVDNRALASDVAARFDAALLAKRQIAATQDATVTSSLRLVLPEEPAAGERFVVLVPEDAPAPGLSITTPARTRGVGAMTGSQTVPVSLGVQFRAGDLLTLQVHDTSWFRLLHWGTGGRNTADLQSRLRAAEADIQWIRQNAIFGVRQEGASLPVRPDVRFVEIFGWSDFSSIMRPWDKAVKQANPTVPSAPTAAEMRSMAFDGAANGATNIRFLSEIPDKLPALTAIQYQVDGGAWKDLGAPPFGIGTIMAMAAMAPGDHQLSFRFANYLGTGEPSPPRPVRAHGSVFADDFALGLNWTAGRLNGRDNWGPPIVSATSASDVWSIVNGNEVTASALNARSVMFTTWNNLSAAGGAGLFVQGVIHRSNGATRDMLVALTRKSAESADNIRLGKDNTNWRLVVAGTLAATGPLPANVTDTITGRIEVTPDGLKIRAYVEGELVATVDNPFARGALLFPGLYYSAPGSSTATGTATARDFSAGRVAA